MTEGCNESDIWIARIDDDFADGACVFKANTFQDLPASTDFQTPSPFEMLPRMQASPVPT